jgi:ABC-type molybdate transport system substrate-binding protein
MRVLALVLAASCLLGATSPGVTGVTFSADGADQILDLHGDPASADLVIFAGGNEWFAMPDVVAAFKQAHPEVIHIYYETLPPGIISQQMATGTLRVGELEIKVKPDVLVGGARGLATARTSGVIEDPVTFASNTLGIMVRAGNPKHVNGLADLGRVDVRVAMPNPKTEGIARQIESSYRKAGGDALDRTVMQKKVAAGTTTITTIHHRQTPMWLLSGKVDAGPVWITEGLYQQRIGSGLAIVKIPATQNSMGVYQAAIVRGAAHAAAAAAFTQFLVSPQAQAIYRSYGFAQPVATQE